jgi:glycosyltransferase involved in cell wall biosynthesis
MLAIIRLFIKFKLILTIHAIPSQLPFWYTKIYPILCKLSEFYIVEDRVALKYLVKNKISFERIKHIKIGVENHDEIQKVKDIKKEFGIPKDSIVLLNISRMIPQKGQKDLILMMKELIKQRPEMKFHLIIIGYGQEEERLKKLSQNLDLESIVSFAGKRIDIGNFYACSDWFLMPCYDESMGVVIYDALIHNIPVIAYNNGSVSEAIDSERKGYLVNPHYTEMVNVLIENYPPKRIKLSKDEIYQYSAERMADEYEYIYGKLE